MKIAFVVSEFNSEVTAPMEQRARRHAESLGVEVARVVEMDAVREHRALVKGARPSEPRPPPGSGGRHCDCGGGQGQVAA